MVVEAFGAELAPDAAVIDAAPRRGRIKPMMIIDPDDAGLDGGRYAMSTRDIAGADRGGEAERGIIGQTQRLRFVLERCHRGEGTEHLLLEDAHGALYVGEH